MAVLSLFPRGKVISLEGSEGIPPGEKERKKQNRLEKVEKRATLAFTRRIYNYGYQEKNCYQEVCC
jgi:hypothetical protein